MRNQLRKLNGVRNTFTGTFIRYGFKSGYCGQPLTTLLLKDIRDKWGNIRSDHLWFNLTKEFDLLPIEEGDRLQFDARVTEYIKGYRGWDEMEQFENPIETDYKLSRPTNIRKVESQSPNPTTN